MKAPAAPGAAGLTAGAFDLGTSGSTTFVAHFRNGTDLKLSGNLNSMWFSAGATGGTATISGDSNTIVFMPSAVPDTITVTGAANTIYLVAGAPTTVTGSGAALTTVKYYQP